MEEQLEDKINFWVNGVCTCGIVIGGVILNCFSIYIIWKKYENVNIFFQMIISLLCFDILVLVTWINLSLYIAFKVDNIVVLSMFPYFSVPFVQIAITVSTFMTVAIAHERYLAVRAPLKYRQYMKIPKLQTQRLRLYLFIVIITSVAINVPHFMELEVRYIDDSLLADKDLCHRNTSSDSVISELANDTNQGMEDMNSNSTTTPILCYTALGENPYYLYYYRNWTKLMVTGVIPYVLLVFFNTYIYKAIKKNARMIEETGSNEPMPTSTKRKDEENLSMVFVGIVTIFLVCHSLKIGLNVYDGIFGKVGATSAIRIVGYFSNFLVVLNSAINMIIYCIMNRTFRNHFVNTIKNLLPCVNQYVEGSQRSRPSPTTIARSPRPIPKNNHQMIELNNRETEL